jgi:hypothetical protein
MMKLRVLSLTLPACCPFPGFRGISVLFPEGIPHLTGRRDGE